MKTLRLLVTFALVSCEPASQPPDRTTAASEFGSPSIAVLSSTAVIESTSAPADLSPPAGHDLTVLRSELIIPVSGVIAGELRDTFTGARSEGRLHDAIDIPAPRGTAVLSAGRGRVLKLFTSKAGGLMVYAADSTERFILLYGHLDGYAPGLADGSPLARGQTIGFVGTTGNAPPNLPHLHFAIARSQNISEWWKGTALNPYPVLKNK